MPPTPQNADSTQITLTRTAEYRDSYANSVQVRLSIWDFFLVFGTLDTSGPSDHLRIENFQGIYLSPQQAKALANVLSQNIEQYEQTFGPISLDGAAAQRFAVPSGGPVH